MSEQRDSVITFKTKMQEVSCGEALYGFWHVGKRLFAANCSQLCSFTDRNEECAVMQ